jgi:hypothetical protein
MTEEASTQASIDEILEDAGALHDMVSECLRASSTLPYRTGLSSSLIGSNS